jgi:stage V sporulation protein B
VLPFTANSKDKKSMTDFMNKVIRVTFAVIILFAVFLTIISKPIIILVLSKKFAGSVTPFKLLIPGISIFAINNIFNNYFTGSGLVSKNIIASGVAAAITVILDFTLIPIYGINGAAITSSISYTVCTLISLYFYKMHTQSKLVDILLIKRSDLLEIKTKLSGLKKKF